MKSKYVVGILFCGGCNCYFDREKLYKDIKEALGEYCEFVYYSSESDVDYDIVVLINGCQSECLMGEGYKAKLLLINNKNYDNAVDLIEKELGISVNGEKK